MPSNREKTPSMGMGSMVREPNARSSDPKPLKFLPVLRLLNSSELTFKIFNV